ncbi:PREDICTED: SIEVE ELEMENT OCCLUSION B [Prunus dulcis]|uniref:PREDICTED: SIEVE ELEMENT OCCLUSION B n=1 Tax=Prunus dulcis TaxID=3755 RepID=A0A5E4FTF0_PRUDU|nr:PREDICTED: SIEVE ELEMENT OCCLUSION B [Prunus dulcis]
MYELDHKVSTLGKENSDLIEKLNVLENDKSLLLHRLILFEFEKSLVEHEKIVVHDKLVVENSVLQCMLFEKDIEVQNLFEMVKSLENNMVKQSESFDALQFENIRLEHELELEKEKIQGLTIGAGKIDKMLNFEKLFGDKRGLGYIDESSTPSSFETIFVKDVSTQEAPKFVHDPNLGFDSMNIVSKGKLSLPQSNFVPTCDHCGVKGHIRPSWLYVGSI